MSSILDAKLICFDNDGTIFASHEVANPAIQKRFVQFTAEHGLDLPPPDDARILELTGSPGPVFYRELLPPPLRHLAEEFRRICIDEEVIEVERRGRLFDGVESLLKDLREKGKKLALVTNGGERYVSAVARRLDYDRCLDGIYHFGMDGLETKTAMIRRAMLDLGTEDAVMVGDRASDRDAAKQVGIPFIGCQFGYGGEEETEGADRIAHSIAELRAHLISE